MHKIKKEFRKIQKTKVTKEFVKSIVNERWVLVLIGAFKQTKMCVKKVQKNFSKYY